jgi:hypothetical protein
VRILGAHIVGPHADEVINLFGLAMRHKVTARDLQTTMFALSNRRVRHRIYGLVAWPTGIQNIEHRAIGGSAVGALRHRFRQDGLKLHEISELGPNIRQMCTRDPVHLSAWGAPWPS